MKKILALGASNNSRSINKQFATFAAQQLQDSTLTIADLNDYPLPLYGPDLERSNGVPQAAHDFIDLISQHDAIVISFAEYNGGYTTVFKNLQDWASRVRKDVWQQKPMLLLSTSPGSRGGANVMAGAVNYFPHLGAKIVENFSLPFFHKTFNSEQGILDSDLNQSFKSKLKAFEKALNTLLELSAS